MASSSKPSDEEMKKAWADRAQSYADKRGGVPDPSAPGASQVIWAQHGGGSGHEFGDIAPTIHTDKSGRRYIKNPHGAGDFRFNERTGAWQAPGGDALMISEATPVAVDNGGGSPQAVPQQQQGYVDYGNVGNTMSGGTETIVNRQPMDDWRPTARNSNGGGVYNPLVNPTNWMVDIAPTPIRNTGRYVKPNKLSYNGGLLNGFID